MCFQGSHPVNHARRGHQDARPVGSVTDDVDQLRLEWWGSASTATTTFTGYSSLETTAVMRTYAQGDVRLLPTVGVRPLSTKGEAFADQQERG